jgi:hypothetical protein
MHDALATRGFPSCVEDCCLRAICNRLRLELGAGGRNMLQFDRHMKVGRLCTYHP